MDLEGAPVAKSINSDAQKRGAGGMLTVLAALTAVDLSGNRTQSVDALADPHATKRELADGKPQTLDQGAESAPPFKFEIGQYVIVGYIFTKHNTIPIVGVIQKCTSVVDAHGQNHNEYLVEYYAHRDMGLWVDQYLVKNWFRESNLKAAF